METLRQSPLSRAVFEEKQKIDPKVASGMLVAASTKIVLPDGRIMLEHNSAELPFIVTPLGMELASQNPHLLVLPALSPENYTGIEHFPGGQQSEFVVKQVLRNHGTKYPVAVKYIGEEAYNKPTGIATLRGLRCLQEMGVECASPILATKELLVTKWIDGEVPRQNDSFFLGFLNHLASIAYTLRVKNKLPYYAYVDQKRDNYRVLNNRIIVIDPFYYEDADRQGFTFEFSGMQK